MAGRGSRGREVARRGGVFASAPDISLSPRASEMRVRTQDGGRRGNTGPRPAGDHARKIGRVGKALFPDAPTGGDSGSLEPDSR